MSKKINLFFLLISCLLFTSFSPSLDGRAVVADSGVLPEGYFAKTVGYLPGDSIIVSNFAAGKTLDILVVGSLDQSEGVAILLSPEAAAELGIVKNSNVIVKLTKRSGELDEAVSGTAVIAQGETLFPSEENTESTAADSGFDGIDSAESEDKSGEESPLVSGDETLIAESADDAEQAEGDVQNDEGEVDKAESDAVQSVSDERVTDEPAVTEENDENGGYVADETDAVAESAESVNDKFITEDEGSPADDGSEAFSEAISEIEEEKPSDEKIIAEDVPEERDEGSEAVTDDIPAEAATISDERVTDEPVVTEADDENGERSPVQTDIPAESEAVAETAVEAEEKVSEDEKIIAEDIPEDAGKTPETVSEALQAETEEERGVTDEPLVTEAETDETLAPTEEKALAESVPPAEEAPADEKIAADVPPEEERDIASETIEERAELPAEEKTETLVAETIESDKSADDKAYSAIVLSNTDDSESVTESSVQTSDEVRKAESVQIESVSEVSTVQSTVSSSRDSGTAASIAREYGARTAENLSSLDKGTYYVQIASFANPSNIRETLAKYGRDYPVTLVPLASKAATQVMIGPLSVDEYAVVLERFKLYGYKDAFVRKVR
ncbi:hypothetical protein HMPREF1221_00845 [Treponema socranskii subsp. paredis ATCC 35535]|nr:hypothetical protein HMPREF1221_00845 [Treponema socranskii subsp. paredis ATCC 35535]